MQLLAMRTAHRWPHACWCCPAALQAAGSKLQRTSCTPSPPLPAPAVKYYNPASNLCVVRCSRDEYRQVRAGAAIQAAAWCEACSPCAPRARTAAAGAAPCLHPASPPAALFLATAQVWGSLCFITEIRHRVVLLRLLHLTGTVAACQQAALACHGAVTAGRRLPPALAKLGEEANARLGAMAV